MCDVRKSRIQGQREHHRCLVLTLLAASTQYGEGYQHAVAPASGSCRTPCLSHLRQTGRAATFAMKEADDGSAATNSFEVESECRSKSAAHTAPTEAAKLALRVCVECREGEGVEMLRAISFLNAKSAQVRFRSDL
eukprot:308782-Pleurochrysis_carterae.AAC.1